MDSAPLLPQWPAPECVRALCSTRGGGQSRPPWASLNLGDHVGDAPEAVAANRAAWARQLGVRPVYLQQVHGDGVVHLSGDEPDGSVADACYTDRSGVACTIMVADCLPVLLCDLRGGQVGAAHAGWRGLAGVTPRGSGPGVLEALASRFDPAHSIAWLGPCIGPEAFEVGQEVRVAFEAWDPGCGPCFRPHTRTADRSLPPKWWADLPGLARRRLQALGITRIFGNDSSAPWCTFGNPSRFFSHRRDRISGRLAASIWLA